MQPNIVFAFADDWGRYASAYKNKAGESSIHELIKTPNFDRVAEEGALFLNANVPAPSCTPCRSSILSGRYFWQTGLGAILMGARWDESIPTYPLILEKNGYHIGYTYKVWAPGVTKNAPYGGERTAFESAGSRFNNFSHEATDSAIGLGKQQAKQELFDEVRNNFDSFIEDRPDGAPFCYWWGPTNTHRSWEQGSGKELWGLEPDNLKRRMPEFLPDVHEIREDFNDYLGECQAFDTGLGIILKRLEEIGELDNTIVVVSGDHGIPGFPRAKSNLYNIGTEVALAIRWPECVSPGREVKDFINLMDLAPTFLDVAGIEPPESMTAKSLMPLLKSNKNGQVQMERDSVVTGRERHVATARKGHLPYPQRAIRTADFLYIINFEPDRWPAGDPIGLDDPTTIPPSRKELLSMVFGVYKTAFPDIDGSPTKAWMVHNRAKKDVQPFFDLGFGKRPKEELYDLRKDPDYLINVANDPIYLEIKSKLETRLMSVLNQQNDPRVTESPSRFENTPFAGPLTEEWLVQSEHRRKQGIRWG